MTTERHLDSEKGLLIGTKAPFINTSDVFEKKIDFSLLFKEYRGIFLDFSRGAW
ncbi:MAG: hypothetical protein KGD58_10555 [Candidatus Lokiarchaeota archaeon]|nr:hypothetical protein [Candidatus Lokiarchaeota archaeon]